MAYREITYSCKHKKEDSNATFAIVGMNGYCEDCGITRRITEIKVNKNLYPKRRPL
jgi:hypothetical protein